MRNQLLIFATVLSLSACATTNRGKALELAFSGGLVGATLGQTKSEYKTQNTVMYGSLGALVALIAGLFIFDEGKRAEDFRTKALELQSQSDGAFLSGDSMSTQNQKMISQGNSSFSESEIPEEYQHLVRPGGWKVYEINRWVKRSSNRLVLESKLLEFTPPTIQPNAQ